MSKEKVMFLGEIDMFNLMKSNLTSIFKCNAPSKNTLLGMFFLNLVVLSMSANSQTLEESVAKSLIVDPSIKQTYSRMKATQSDQDFSSGDFYPTLTLRGGAGSKRTNNLSGSKINDEANTTELELILKQPIFNGMSTYNDVKRIGHEVKAERLKLYAEAEAVAINVIEIYLNLLASNQVLELAQRNQDDHHDIREDVKIKVSNQLAAQSDLAQVESRLANAMASTIAAKNRKIDLETEYRILVGELPVDMVEPVPNTVELPSSEYETIKRASENHYAILSAMEDTRATEREYSVASGGYYPDVYLELSARDSRFWNDGNGNPNTGNTSDTAIMLRVEYKLFNGGKDTARRRSSLWRHKESIELQAATKRQVRQEAYQTWSAYELLKQQEFYLKQNVDNSKLAEAGYREQFKVGRRELLDVLISKTDLFRARKSYIETHFQQLIATYKLKYVTGRLMPGLHIEFPNSWK